MRKLVVVGGALGTFARCQVRSRLVSAAVLTILVSIGVLGGAPIDNAALAGAPALVPAGAPAAAPPSIGGCQMFPTDNVWNARVDTLPTHAKSDNWVNSVGRNTGLKADFGSGLWQGSPIGIPFMTIPGTQAPATIDFYYPDESDPGPYRIPPDALIEGGSDNHILLVDRDRCELVEVFDASKNPDGSWSAGSGARWSLTSNALRTAGWTSADAAGLPILPGLARYDEMAAGEITHALRFTAQQTQYAYLWPARHRTSGYTSVDIPPMGARARLKSSVNVNAYPTQMRVVLTALQRYGMYLADNGSNWYISGVPDERWDNTVLHRLGEIVGNNMEFVDESSLMSNVNSAQVRATGPTATPTSTSTPTPVPTATPRPSCSPRPSDRIGVVRTASGVLTVTVTAGVGSGAPNNRLYALRFGSPTNATIRVGSQTVAGGTRLALAANTTQTTFTVNRISSSAGATVPLVVEDDCGDWSTFVGGGPTAF
ncbi:MAG: hypothetical protein U0893_13515 [Chloroflexota bacterium]